MLNRNNPNIDFDQLESDMLRNLQRIEAATSHPEAPAAAAKLPPTSGDTSPTEHKLSLDDLYRLDGKRFIKAAYAEFLGREPDEEGRRAHLDELASGGNKADILAGLRYSEEGRLRSQRLQLRGTRLRLQLETLPLVGSLLKTIITVAGISNLKRSTLAWHHQTQDGLQELQGGLQHLHDHLNRVETTVSQEVQNLHRRADLLTQDINDAEHELNVQRANTVDEMKTDIQALEARMQRDFRSLHSMQDRLQTALANSPAGSTSEADELQLQGSAPWHDFYRRFEEHFRGPISEITQRLSFYPPLLHERLPEALKSLPAIDLGCGRGEWLDLMEHHGYKVSGVDLDHANVQLCSERSLSVELADALTHLRACPSESTAVIAALHVIEHLPFSYLNMLLVEVMRVLAPGGLLLLETPNPENLITAAHQFYLDPSHRQPLPPDLTEFVLDYHGFVQVEIHRLHPAGEQRLAEEGPVADRLNELVAGPRDYAALAAKPT